MFFNAHSWRSGDRGCVFGTRVDLSSLSFFPGSSETQERAYKSS